jgi:hypothetical protein
MESVSSCGNELDPSEIRVFTDDDISHVAIDHDKR